MSRPDPDRLLRRVMAEERRRSRGRLKVFLGYASGVGKSHRMFDEGRRRKLRGEDVVVVAEQDAVPLSVRDVVVDLPAIPLRVEHGGAAIDVDAVVRRRPAVALIDGLAHDNPPGSGNAQRWQDVEELLNAGISVVTTINLQYVRELRDRTAALFDTPSSESVPEAFLRTADEIEVVDAPPEYCVGAGAGTAVEVARRERALSELREMALLLAAEVVDFQLADYLRRNGIEQVYGTHERILVCVTPRSNAAEMIRRGRRQADRFHGDLHVVYVEQPGLSAADQATVEANLMAARAVHASVATLRERDPVTAILRHAREHGITQIFVGHSHRRGLGARLRAGFLETLVGRADGIDVRVFPNA